MGRIFWGLKLYHQTHHLAADHLVPCSSTSSSMRLYVSHRPARSVLFFLVSFSFPIREILSAPKFGSSWKRRRVKTPQRPGRVSGPSACVSSTSHGSEGCKSMYRGRALACPTVPHLVIRLKRGMYIIHTPSMHRTVQRTTITQEVHLMYAADRMWWPLHHAYLLSV